MVMDFRCTCIDRIVELHRDTAVTMALHIVNAAAALEGLRDQERDKLRSIADIRFIAVAAAY
jgi:hypothetical protein